MEKPPFNKIQNIDDQIIALPDKNGMIFFEMNKIIRCHSDNSYTDFYISDERAGKKGSIKVVVSKGFEYFEDVLVTKGFFYRIHNRHIINIKHICRYTKNS